MGCRKCDRVLPVHSSVTLKGFDPPTHSDITDLERGRVKPSWSQVSEHSQVTHYRKAGNFWGEIFSWFML